MKRKLRILLLVASACWLQHADAQIPVELFGGDKKASFDLMFFRYFKQKTGQNSRFLFFSRERAVADYRQTSGTFLPQFGFTEAVSYNHPALKGFAPVLVGQILNTGTLAKAGVQYARVQPDFTVFGWWVVELHQGPKTDLFLLMRYTPVIRGAWRFFGQIELLNSLPTQSGAPFLFTQRLRLGLKKAEWQFGLGGDFTTSGRREYAHTENTGLFLRHEF